MNTVAKLNALFAKFKFLPQLLSRVTIGYVFAMSGWGKLHHLDKVIGFFKSLGIPVPELHAPFVATTELVCGVLILIGLFTQLASIPLIGIMCVAIATAKLADIDSANALFTTYEYVYIIVLLWLMTEGPGKIAVGSIFSSGAGKKKKK